MECGPVFERAALFHLLHLPPVWRHIWLPMTGLAGYTALTLWLEQHLLKHDITFPAGVHALLAVVLGFLLVFRTNSAYDRWWEGRRLWGQLVNDTRNLALKVKTLVPAGQRGPIAELLTAFPAGLRDHLRGEASLTRLGLPDPPEPVAHVPLYLVDRLYALLKSWSLDPMTWLLLDRQISGLMDVCGGCERIRNTPIPRSHEAFIRLCILLYLLVLPIGLDYGPWIFPAVLVIGYFLLGVEQVAEEIQDPFGKEPDELPLDRICVTIAESVKWELKPEQPAA